MHPVNKGSGGGTGNGGLGGSGGGAIRLSVGGTLTLDGLLTANGTPYTANNAGGGSAGSVYLTLGALQGTGTLSAIGGRGESSDGGGGAGGRVAIYASDTSGFPDLASHVLLAGGVGHEAGGDGTLYLGLSMPTLAGVTNNPAGLVARSVSTVDVFLSTPVTPDSVSVSDVSVQGPGGSIDSAELDVTLVGGTIVRVSFPSQTALGEYQVTVGPDLTGLFGQSMTSAYSGTFTITQPTLSGTVADGEGAPVADVLITPSGGLPTMTTGPDGTYTLLISPEWSGTVAPSKSGWFFVPGSRTYTSVQADTPDQDYVMIETIAPELTAVLEDSDYRVSWNGILGVDYQALSSSNLVDWVNYGLPLSGTNGPASFVFPVGNDPMMFFHVDATN